MRDTHIPHFSFQTLHTDGFPHSHTILNPTAVFKEADFGYTIRNPSASCFHSNLLPFTPNSSTEVTFFFSTVEFVPKDTIFKVSPGFGTVMHQAYKALSFPTVKRKSVE